MRAATGSRWAAALTGVLFRTPPDACGRAPGTGHGMADASRRLVVVRHAKSAWPKGVPDAQRPLNERGRRDAPAAGRWLRRHVEHVDAVLCSPAERTRQTWELLAAMLGSAPDPVFDARLYGAAADMLLTVVRELPRRRRLRDGARAQPGYGRRRHVADRRVAEDAHVGDRSAAPCRRLEAGEPGRGRARRARDAPRLTVSVTSQAVSQTSNQARKGRPGRGDS